MSPAYLYGFKLAEDRPVVATKTLGPLKFNIEILKGEPRTIPGEKKPVKTFMDYGHLPGYTGPDGDSLDFFVGNKAKGELHAYLKQKNYDGSGFKTTDVKFLVGVTDKQRKAFDTMCAELASDKMRFQHNKTFTDWVALQKHIDATYKK